MKAVLCFICLILGVSSISNSEVKLARNIAFDVSIIFVVLHSGASVITFLTIQVVILWTNFPANELETLRGLIRQAWDINRDLRTRAARLAELAGNTLFPNAAQTLVWNVVINEDALYYRSLYYTTFKIREGSTFKVVTLFTTNI